MRRRGALPPTRRKPEKKAEKGITFGEAVKRWKKEHVDLRLKPSTKKYYADLVDAYLNPFFENMPLAEITRRNVKEAGLRHIRIHDLRGTYTSLAVSAGVPIYYVSKSLGHSDTATTERNYASLAPGAARETPNVMERYIQNATVRNANQMRTEGIEDETPLSGESVTA